MAAHVQNVVTWTTTAGNKTAALTPAVNGLLVVVAGQSGIITPGTVADDRGGTYTFILSCVRSASNSYGAIYVRNQLVTSAVLHTVTLTTGGADTGGGLNVFEFSGMTRTGSGAVRQSGKEDNKTTGTPTCVLSVGAALTTNPLLGATVVILNPAAETPPTGWTERQDVGYATPTSGLETATIDSGFTGSSVVWGAASSAAYGAMAIELDASATGAASLVLPTRGRRIQPILVR